MKVICGFEGAQILRNDSNPNDPINMTVCLYVKAALQFLF